MQSKLFVCKLAACVLSTIVMGCKKQELITVFPEARNIKAVFKKPDCTFIDSHIITDAHPDNIARELKNIAYQKGANRYYISKVLSDTDKPRPTSVMAQLYRCDEHE
ncbi:hypothetical protein [Spartinivicinus poritis]|uniref:DUF4156 domain-containing protein n=1 Tax=Spartinivicinus poritis TaxID=2994640 RepID=A0ABT5U7R3_9GAMM|nr:hypothetical protein [Spartinivicinus sp. A2-2]MDE1462400.1 hypothetical protein [Spartinivicinus sp. A2-2]